MRKPAFCICENKGADQLHDNCTADLNAFIFATQEYNPSTSEIQNFKPLVIFFGCEARFVSDLIRNPEDRFSHDAAQIVMNLSTLQLTL